MTIAEWLARASNELADAMIPTARLDAEIILAHTLNKPRTWIHAHGDETLDPRRQDIAEARTALRLDRVPIAYIVGHKEFYGRRYYVSLDVLIPRPESEAIITLLLKYCPTPPKHIVDVGTGSGCLGITAKLEYPDATVTLIDTSRAALAIAKKNAAFHSASVRTIEASLLDEYPLRAEAIIANLPYVDVSWPEQSPEIKNEPATALYADDEGLLLINQLISQAPSHLQPGGVFILEADPRQHQRIIEQCQNQQLQYLETDGFALAFRYD
jgi:release factor glutamine methyltransferase